MYSFQFALEHSTHLNCNARFIIVWRCKIHSMCQFYCTMRNEHSNNEILINNCSRLKFIKRFSLSNRKIDFNLFFICLPLSLPLSLHLCLCLDFFKFKIYFFPFLIFFRASVCVWVSVTCFDSNKQKNYQTRIAKSKQTCCLSLKWKKATKSNHSIGQHTLTTMDETNRNETKKERNATRFLFVILF